MKKWRVQRAARAVVAPDPADCGTAWGLELTVPKPLRSTPQRRKR